MLFVRAVIVAVAVYAAGTAHAQTTGAGIGYPSPQAALKALHARPDVVFSLQNGWIIASDRANVTVWSFAEASNPAFPAAVKRQVVQNGDKVYVAMSILCGGPQAECDKLPAEFQALDHIKSPAN
jgi:hypothetical protein